MMKAVLVWGCGGHAKVIANTLRDLGGSVDAYIVDRDDGCLGPGDAPRYTYRKSRVCRIFNAQVYMGLGDNWIRHIAVQKILASHPDFKFPPIIHPSAVVATSAEIGVGAVVLANSVVGPDARVGDFTIVNSGAIVEHDCEVSAFASLGPNATLGGGSTIGEYTAVGMGALVRNGVQVGAHSVVGMGSVVVSNIGDCQQVVGVPAQIQKIRSVGERYL